MRMQKKIDVDGTLHSFSVSIVTVKKITNVGPRRSLWLCNV